jgi:hypothetical protein
MPTKKRMSKNSWNLNKTFQEPRSKFIYNIGLLRTISPTSKRPNYTLNLKGSTRGRGLNGKTGR